MRRTATANARHMRTPSNLSVTAGAGGMTGGATVRRTRSALADIAVSAADDADGDGEADGEGEKDEDMGGDEDAEGEEVEEEEEKIVYE